MNQSFGFHIKKMRTEMGVSLGDLANQTGIPEAEVQKIEAGSITASREQIFRLAQSFARR